MPVFTEKQLKAHSLQYWLMISASGYYGPPSLIKGHMGLLAHSVPSTPDASPHPWGQTRPCFIPLPPIHGVRLVPASSYSVLPFMILTLLYFHCHWCVASLRGALTLCHASFFEASMSPSSKHMSMAT